MYSRTLPGVLIIHYIILNYNSFIFCNDVLISNFNGCCIWLKLSLKIQRPHHFKDRIPYTRRYFIQFLSTHVKSSYWFPVLVLKISHYLRLNYLWQVVCYFFHRKILLSFISKIHGLWQFVEFLWQKN